MANDNDAGDYGAPLFPEERGEFVDHGPLAQEDRVDLIQEVPGDDVSSEALRDDVDRADTWLHYNKGLEGTGFSPADRITPDNVDGLEEAYTVETDSGGLQANPIVTPGDPPALYFTTTNFKVVAVNARTGEEFWTTQVEVPDDPGGIAWANRGVAVMGDKLFMGIPTPEMVAIDRYTGEVQWKETILADDQKENELQDRISITQMPLAYDGRLFFGQSSDYGGWTYVNAMNAEDGSMEWQIQTAPENEWVEDTWRFSSGASWMTPALDPESGRAYYTIGNPDPMLNGVVRPGPNRYTNSVMAVDVESGEIDWVHQNIPHEVWDYDTHVTPTLMDLEVAGETRRVVYIEDKGATPYILDAETGRLVERPEAPVRQDHEWSPGFLAMPPAGEENAGTIWPGFTYAGVEWPPDTVSRRTGWRYVGANHASNEIWYDPDWEYDEDNPQIEMGGGATEPSGTGEHYAAVVATNPATGQVEWEHKLEDVDPDWAMSRLVTGGTTSTAGGVVFHMSSGGSMVALDDETGDRLWRDDAGDVHPRPGPISWDDPAENTQYVAGLFGDTLVAYGLEAE